MEESAVDVHDSTAQQEGEGPGMKQFFVSHILFVEKLMHAELSFQRIFTFMSTSDVFLNILGCTCAIGAGISQPLMAIVFGSFIVKFTDFGSGVSTPPEFRADVNSFAYVYVYGCY